MRHIFLILFFACIFLAPFVAQAGEEPVIFYSFDNVEDGTVEDLSGFDNDGALINKPKSVNGQLGKGLEFENNYVELSVSDSLNADFFQGSFTVVVWINAKLTGNEWQAIFTSEGPLKSRDTLFINKDGRISWRGRVNGAWAGGMCETDPGIVEADKWTHIAVVSDEKSFRVYADGELIEESDFQKTDGGNDVYYLADTPFSAGQSYSGVIDDFAILTRPLTTVEVKSVMGSGVEEFAAVEPAGKLATKWAMLKSAF
ncbi:LamG domain-containing protein [Candidatus Poribacteria bacterium]